MSTINEAVKVVGGQQKLAVAVDVNQTFVSQWVTGRRKVPAGRCIAIETATAGVVTRYDLRPDIFGTAPLSKQAV